MDKKVKVYSTPTCPFCIRAKQFLKESNVVFENIDVATDQEKAQEMIKKSGQMGVPVIDIDGTIIVGFDKDKIEYVNSVLSRQRISSSAHTAIVVSGEDEYYGEQGEYCNCLHYYPHDMAKYQDCINQGESVMQGEVTAKNLKQGTLRRLMYNPHFSTLKIAMQSFIDKLPSA